MGSRRRRDDRSRGQALAEFAIVFPVFMLLVGGLIQFGLLFWAQNTLTQVARDTGRWAASQQTRCNLGSTRVAQTAAELASSSSLIGYPSPDFSVDARWTNGAGGNVTGSLCVPSSNAQVVWVTIGVTHRVPTFFPFVPGNGLISTEARFRMEPRAGAAGS